MKKIKKSNFWILLTAVVAIVVSVSLLLGRKSTTNYRDTVNFSIPDTASVHWIFMADQSGGKVLLQRNTDGRWLLDGKETAMRENVNDLLSVLKNMTVKMPVSKAATDNVLKWLATGATKVQISYSDFRIRLGRFQWWKCDRKKTFYIGSPTPDNLGNYAIMEKSGQPFVVYVPGFRGFISPYFSTMVSDWKSHELLNLRISEIAEVRLTDFEHEEASLLVKRHGEKHFDICSLPGEKPLDRYDTVKLYDHLSSYRKLNFEFFAEKPAPEKRDSILSERFKELIVTDTRGNRLKITMYHMLNEYNTEEFDYQPEFMDLYNRDKFYITLDDNTSDFYICQFFVFDRIIQPLSYYLIGNESYAIPR
jgi:hypothetical protein